MGWPQQVCFEGHEILKPNFFKTLTVALAQLG
jgi:hypothetical protein